MLSALDVIPKGNFRGPSIDWDSRQQPSLPESLCDPTLR